MLNKAIENWLTNTKERNYQKPYCQILRSKGHRVLYISKHGQLEHGKDIVSVDAEGVCHCYQLKTGNLNKTSWRYIKGEIQELIELGFTHHLVDNSKNHKSYLVLNGYITDPVRSYIESMNTDNIAKNRNFSSLDVIELDGLLKDFIDYQTSLSPFSIEGYDKFFGLYLSDGNDFIDKDLLFTFLSKSVFNKSLKRKTDYYDAINGSILTTSYTLNKYQHFDNYYAQFEAWTMLAAYIIWLSYDKKLVLSKCKQAYDLAFEEALSNLSCLAGEFLGKENLLEGDTFFDGGELYRARGTILLGSISALLMHEDFQLPKSIDKGVIRQKMLTYSKYLWFWGDSAFPFFYHFIKWLESENESTLANELLTRLLVAIAAACKPGSSRALPSPYYSSTDVIEVAYGLDHRKFDFGEFSGASFILPLVVNMAAKRGLKTLLDENWKDISLIQGKEFTPEKLADSLLWRIDHGQNTTTEQTKTQSYSKLVDSAKHDKSEHQLYSEYQSLFSFLILIYPHRATVSLLKVLDG